MSGLEVVPQRLRGSGSARGPPASQARKTGLPPGLPYIGAVSAEQKQLHAVPGLGRHEAPGRTPVSCLDHYTTARNRRCTRSRRRTIARRTTFSVVVQVGDRLPLLG